MDPDFENVSGELLHKPRGKEEWKILYVFWLGYKDILTLYIHRLLNKGKGI